MAVELILLEDVAHLGKIGDKVRVSDGYARNFLLPRKLAAKTAPAVLRTIEAKKLRLQKDHEERLGVAKLLAEKLSSLSVSLSVQAGEDDKLYGAIHAGQIVEELVKEGITLEKEVVNLAEPIKALGSYNVEIVLHPDVKTTLKVWVVRA